MAPLWTLRLLGGLQAVHPQRTITRFRSQKIAELLGYLACHPHRQHPREELIDLLWPEAPLDTGRANLRTALASLRRQLEPPGVPTGAVLVNQGNASVSLNPVAVTTDVAAFETALTLAERGDTPAERAGHLEEAVRTYGGPLLPGCYADWVVLLREHLIQRYVTTLGRLAVHFEGEEDLDTALDYARRGVYADPLNARVRGDLVRLLARSGRTQAALAQYDELERLLRETLDSTPASWLRELAAQIRQGRFPVPAAPCPTRNAPRAPDRNKVSLPPPSLPANDPQGAGGRQESRPVPRHPLLGPLPVWPTRFFGRQGELESLELMLTSREARLITITGPAGTGKTRLAVEAVDAWSLGRSSRNGYGARPVDGSGRQVAFVSLVGVRDAGQIPAAVAEVVGVTLTPEQPALDQLIQSLAGPTHREPASARPALLVLDNFEQLVEEGAQVVHALLAGAPHVRCLATSRQRLQLEGEWEVPLSPLPLPRGSDTTPERLLEYPSVQMFVDRAQAARPDFQLTPRNGKAVAELCMRLEGLPLALELAAGWARVASPEQMLVRLHARLDFLAGSRRDLPSRHRSLRAALDSSYELLPPPARRLFAVLSVFRGGWTLEAAEALVSGGGTEPAGGTAQPASETAAPPCPVMESLLCLREHSLIRTEEQGDAMRFGMLESVREYAAAQLALGEAQCLARRHASYYAALVTRTNADWQGDLQARTLGRLQIEHDNFRAALEWSLTERDETALRLAGPLGRFWLLCGYWVEGREWLRRVIETRMEAAPALWARVLRSAALMGWGLDLYGEAASYCEEALRLWRQIEEPYEVAGGLSLCGRLAQCQGQYDRAEQFFQESLEHFRRLGLPAGIASELDRLAVVARERGEYSRARSLHAESYSLHSEHNDRQGMALCLSNLGDVALLEADWEQAEVLHVKALGYFKELGHKPGIAYGYDKLGVIAGAQGDARRAGDLLRQGLALSREIGDRRHMAQCLENVAFQCESERKDERSVRLLGAASALRQNIGAPLPAAREEQVRESLAASRVALGPAAFDRAWMDGRTTPLQEAVALALTPDPIR